MSLNVKIRKRIKKFGAVRFFGNPIYSEKALMRAYEKADRNKRHSMEHEMNIYMQAIKDKRIKSGESILRLAMSDEPVKVEVVQNKDPETI
jgi:hypothetical protein